MGCRTVEDIDKFEKKDLLIAALQASATIENWEVIIPDLQAQIQEKQNIIEYLERNRTDQITPAPTSSKSTKIPDPEPLSDGKDPTFENWKIQIQGKFVVNHDHFSTDQAKMIYIFGRTQGDAQNALKTRYETAKNPFQTSQDMIDHLSNIYLDPYKVENARQDYRRLNMRPAQTFTEFYTKFLQLAGDAEIPQDDWRPDLYEKLTFDLRRAILPVYDVLADHQALADKCRRVDQDLKRLKETTDRIKARNNNASGSKPSGQNAPTNPKPATPTSASQGSTLSNKIRPTYDDPKKQALSREGKCFKCRQFGHFAKNCPNDDVVAELESPETENERSGKVQP
jgi:hypothetical protein